MIMRGKVDIYLKKPNSISKSLISKFKQIKGHAKEHAKRHHGESSEDEVEFFNFF